ncbi:MAG: TrkH family potassium uptake protein [Bacteroidales bacterium]|nr:TrkH family potassium uptake protein [Bacteroidales bacterium]
MKMNWPLIKYVYGVLLMVESFFLGLSTVVALFYHYTIGENDWEALLITTLLAGVLGWFLFRSGRHYSTFNISTREGFFVVATVWILFTVIGMIPYLLTNTCYTITDAFLEAMSGFTTTGCTIITDIDSQSHGILFWRGLTQWLGGLGIVVISMALLPLIGTGATQIFGAETNGLRMDKLRPKITDTARRLFGIYVLLSVANVLLYALGPMSWYDSIVHAFSTMASGGFSTHQSSIGYYHSTYTEYICIIFTFLTTVNFNLYYFFGKGRWNNFWKDEELRWFCFIVLGFTALFMLLNIQMSVSEHTKPMQLLSLGDGTLECLFRTSLFHTLSIVSSAGFQAEYYDYAIWGSIFWLPTLLLMVMGGCSGSTAGGLKVIRFVVLIKNTKNEFLQILHPRTYTSVRVNGQSISNESVHKILAMIFIYLILLIASIFILQCLGLDFVTSIGTSVSALGNTGPALGATGPSFTWSALPDMAKWFLAFEMLVGRLEIFTVIIIFTKMFWKK